MLIIPHVLTNFLCLHIYKTSLNRALHYTHCPIEGVHKVSTQEVKKKGGFVLYFLNHPCYYKN